MGIGGAEDEGFTRSVRIEVLGEFLRDGLVERLGDDLGVEGFDALKDFIGGFVALDAGVGSIVCEDLLSLLPLDAVLNESSGDAGGRGVVAEVAICDGFAIGVVEDRFPEDLGSMQSWGGREADLYGMEVIDDAAVFRDEISFGAEGDFAIIHVLIEDVAAVAFVDDDTVVLIDGRWWIIAKQHNAADHALDCGDMDFSFLFDLGVAELGDVVDVGESLESFELNAIETIIKRLLSEGGSVDEEEDALEALVLNEAVDQRDGGAGLAGAGGHGEEDGIAAFGDVLLNC